MEFALKTETERQLYIEAVFHCLGHALLSHEAVCRDLDALISSSKMDVSVKPHSHDLRSRIEGIMDAYKVGAIEEDIAKMNCLAILADLASSDANPLLDTRTCD